MGRRDLKLNLWLKQRPRLMLRCSKADRGILIGSFASSKHISAYWTTYQHISSCRFHLRWSWRGERRLNSENFVAKKTCRISHRPLPTRRLSLVLEQQSIIFYQTKGETSSFLTMRSFDGAWALQDSRVHNGRRSCSSRQKF